MKSDPNEVVLDLGQRHIIIQRRYEALGALNDLLIALLFLLGSFFFLYGSLVEDGTWLFIAGSALLLIKPVLKVASLVHVSRVFNEKDKI
ncbi:YrhK family protein [uncultured Paraglaciecola sp.]|uniref:YrhK family protein n=1 Tax=uncultured Paraglaciecola sp. TaxID=1765024 RepID=UPI0030DD5866|tara:strand:+ start:6422 stop:6691 length:270 start_codon:yes stop_codon:yes gene_type:complete